MGWMLVSKSNWSMDYHMYILETYSESGLESDGSRLAAYCFLAKLCFSSNGKYFYYLESKRRSASNGSNGSDGKFLMIA